MRLLPIFFLFWIIFSTTLPIECIANEAGDTYTLPDFEDTNMNEEEDSLLPERMGLSWKTSGKQSIIRPDHPLNPEDSFFDFNRNKITTDLDLEWNPKLTETLSFRSRGVASYQNLDDSSEAKAFFLEGYFQWQNRLPKKM